MGSDASDTNLDLLADVTTKAMRLSRAMRHHFLSRAAEFDLNTTDADTLYHLGRGAAMRIGVITAELTLEKTQMTHVIDRLEKRKLVKRSPDPADRRATTVTLTAEGRRVYAKFTDRLTRHAPIGHLPREQLQELSDALSNAISPNTQHH